MMRVRDWSQNSLMAPAEEGYGLELEAENGQNGHIVRAIAQMGERWQVKPDGSLRNNGVEFVSRFLYTNEVEPAIQDLYRLTRNRWRPSLRSGVHVHVNTLHWTMEELHRFFIAYAFVEPLLYRFCGQHREENIFCVPWYRAPDEPLLIAKMFHRGDIAVLRSSCKYSSLYAGPTRSYGTVEFRQAETFDTAGQFMRWWRVIRNIAEARNLGNMIELYSQTDAATVARQVLGDYVSDLTDDEIGAIVESSGAVEIALMFADPVYKYGEWGSPATFTITRQPDAQRDDVPRMELRRAVTLIEEAAAMQGHVWQEFDGRDVVEEEVEEEVEFTEEDEF